MIWQVFAWLSDAACWIELQVSRALRMEADDRFDIYDPLYDEDN